MRRNVYEYEDVRNVHKSEDYNIAVQNITDEMFETLYKHEILYHISITPRDATLVRSTRLWADDSQTMQTRHQLDCTRSQHEPGRTSRTTDPEFPWILGVNHWFRLREIQFRQQERCV